MIRVVKLPNQGVELLEHGQEIATVYDDGSIYLELTYSGGIVMTFTGYEEARSYVYEAFQIKE